MISLQTNVDAMNAQVNLNTDNLAQSKTIQQLTSGFRINSSGDDAAGLAIANQYRNNIAEMTQGVNNANDAIAQLQIIDGGLSNISNILDRLKTLATESASATFAGSRATLDQEFQAQLTEITNQATNIGLNTGGAKNASLAVYVGGGSANTITVNLSGATNAVDAVSLGFVAGTKIDTTANALTALGLINTAITNLGTAQGTVGAGENQLQYAVNLLNSQITNTATAQSSLRDADVAADASKLTKSQVLEQTAIAAMAQANSEPQSVLKLVQNL